MSDVSLSLSIGWENVEFELRGALQEWNLTYLHNELYNGFVAVR